MESLPTRRRLIAVAVTAALGLPLAAQAATITADGSTCTLADAVTSANTDTATGGCAKGNGDDTIQLSADITLSASAPLPLIHSNIAFDGQSHTIDGGGGRIFFVNSGTVSFNNMTLTNATAQGGNGFYGGGGGMGAGGALFVYGGTVAVSHVTFTNDTAAGGSGGQKASFGESGGGGGMGGTGGGTLDSRTSGGGGGLLFGSNGGGGGENGGGGGGGISAPGTSGEYGGTGGGPVVNSRNTGGDGGVIGSTLSGSDGLFGGGGGGGTASGNGGAGGFGGGGGGSYSGTAGAGGFGGGGGGGGYDEASFAGVGGNGGFGGGGGAGSTMGTGGFGAGGATSAQGGGGAGGGGAIFIFQGSLNLINNSFTGNSAIGGEGGNPGQGLGGAIFAYTPPQPRDLPIGLTAKALPTSTPTVTGCANTFSNNTAQSDTTTNDSYGVSTDLTVACKVAAPPAPVPTLNGWGIGLLGLLMAALGHLGWRRRRREG